MDLIERNTDDSSAGISAEGLLQTIVSEIERLQPENFNNTTVTIDSLLLNHSRCDSAYLDEMLTEFGSEFPEVESDTGLYNKPPNDCDFRLPKANHNKVIRSRVSNFVEENCEETSPIKNGCGSGILEISTVSGGQLNTLISQWKQQQDMILELQMNNLAVKSQMKQQHEMMLTMQKQLNTFTELHRTNRIDENLQKTQVDQEPTAELSDGTQLELAEINTITTNEVSPLSDSGRMEQLQEMESVQSSTADITRSINDISEVGRTEHPIPSYQEDNINQSERSLRIKQVRSTRIRKAYKKHATYNLGCTETSAKNPRNSRKSSKMHSCGECKKQFSWKSNLTVHLRIHSGEKPYQCKVCKLDFSARGNLRTHQRVHSGEKTYKCRECTVAFKHSDSLKAHQRIHSASKSISGEKPYKCKECGVAFNQSGNLRTHQRIHSGEKPYKCKECGVSFRHSNSLKAHQWIHSGEKPYKCSECGAAFNQSSNLRTHQRVHSCEKPYKCRECTVAFKHSDSLKAHQRIHSGEKPYKCKECGVSFRHSNSLKAHQRVHSGEGQFMCGICKKSFQHKIALSFHMDIHSSGKTSHK